MITREQINDLSKFYKIDEFTIFREYLQLVVLSYIYQQKESKKLVFKGGTALRLIHGSPRFSEDLDFSTTLKTSEIRKFVKLVEDKIKKELPTLVFDEIYEGKEGLRLNVKYISEGLKFPLNLRLDFHIVSEVPNVERNTLQTRFPVLVFPTVFYLSKNEILKEKFECIKTRFKGRDIFDIWYILATGENKLNLIDASYYIKKVESYDDNELVRDLSKFLPVTQRTILPNLKKELINNLKN